MPNERRSSTVVTDGASMYLPDIHAIDDFFMRRRMCTWNCRLAYPVECKLYTQCNINVTCGMIIAKQLRLQENEQMLEKVRETEFSDDCNVENDAVHL